MNAFDILGHPELDDVPRFVPCGHFEKFGRQCVFYKGKAGSIKETQEEQELAKIAQEKWQYYQENYRPIEDEFMRRVDQMDSDGAYDFVKGAAGSATAAQFSEADKAVQKNMQARGINPASGNYAAGMDEVAVAQGLSGADTMSRAQVDQQDNFIQGISNITAIGRGQAASAQQGLSDVANLSAGKAATDAFNAHNNRAARNHSLGVVAGAAGKMAHQGLSDDK